LGGAPFGLGAQFGMVVDEPAADPGVSGQRGDGEGLAGADGGVQRGEDAVVFVG